LPAAALEYAQKAVAAEKGNPRPHILDTLAESYYVNGKYEDAIKTEQRAIELARIREGQLLRCGKMRQRSAAKNRQQCK
jgi:tetratricopeptide (TPR) repeat protein